MIKKNISITEGTDMQMSIAVGSRESIENFFYDMAKEHAQLASKDVDRNNVPKMQIEMRHSILTIIMSFTVLEILLNDLNQKITGKGISPKEFRPMTGLTRQWKKLIEENQRHNVMDTNPNLDEEKERVLSELDGLRKLRHQIIHYIPKPEDIKNLRRTPKNHIVSRELELFTAEEAIKAIQTVRTLLQIFEKSTGHQVPKLD